jgi:hypothetical protein
LNPLDRYKRFQFTFSSPFSGLILAQGNFHRFSPVSMTLQYPRDLGNEAAMAVFGGIGCGHVLSSLDDPGANL